jgi:hypothetical protein
VILLNEVGALLKSLVQVFVSLKLHEFNGVLVSPPPTPGGSICAIVLTAQNKMPATIIACDK